MHDASAALLTERERNGTGATGEPISPSTPQGSAADAGAARSLPPEGVTEHLNNALQILLPLIAEAETLFIKDGCEAVVGVRARLHLALDVAAKEALEMKTLRSLLDKTQRERLRLELLARSPYPRVLTVRVEEILHNGEAVKVDVLVYALSDGSVVEYRAHLPRAERFTPCDPIPGTRAARIAAEQAAKAGIT